MLGINSISLVCSRREDELYILINIIQEQKRTKLEKSERLPSTRVSFC